MLCKCFCAKKELSTKLQTLALIADNGGSIKEVQHDRILLTAFVYKVALICTMETRGADHAGLIKSKLEEKYQKDLTWHTVSAHHYDTVSE